MPTIVCVWHLMRNATSHIKDKCVLNCFRNFILGDLKVEQKWRDMDAKYQFEDNSWVNKLYAKRKMWSPIHIKGNFFVGIQTTSCYEIFHSHVAKYVDVKTNLTDFVEQFQRCLTYFRHREVVSDYFLNYGNVPLETNLQSLVRHVFVVVLTKELLLLLCPIIRRIVRVRIVDCKEMITFSVYMVVKYHSESVFHVSSCPSLGQFSYSCF